MVFRVLSRQAYSWINLLGKSPIGTPLLRVPKNFFQENVRRMTQSSGRAVLPGRVIRDKFPFGKFLGISFALGGAGMSLLAVIQSETKVEKNSIPPREVEIKAKIDPAAREQIEAWLNKNAVSHGSVVQSEVYLDDPRNTFFFTNPAGFKDANDYLRVRQTPKGNTLCFKRVHRDKDGKNPYCDEYEVVINDPAMTLALLEQLGFTERTPIEKTRKKYSYGDYEISLDYVKGLGDFVEIELKREETDPTKGLQEMQQFLEKTMGVKDYAKQSHGYASMIWNPDQNFAEKD